MICKERRRRENFASFEHFVSFCPLKTVFPSAKCSQRWDQNSRKSPNLLESWQPPDSEIPYQGGVFFIRGVFFHGIALIGYCELQIPWLFFMTVTMYVEWLLPVPVVPPVLQCDNQCYSMEKYPPLPLFESLPRGSIFIWFWSWLNSITSYCAERAPQARKFSDFELFLPCCP